MQKAKEATELICVVAELVVDLSRCTHVNAIVTGCRQTERLDDMLCQQHCMPTSQ